MNGHRSSATHDDKPLSTLSVARLFTIRYESTNPLEGTQKVWKYQIDNA